MSCVFRAVRCRALLSALAVLCAIPIASVPAQAEIGPDTLLVSVGATSGSGNAEIEMFGKGFGDLLITDILEMRDTDPRFKGCDMALLEWRRRADVLAEHELQNSGFIDPASRTVKGPLLDPTLMIEGTVTDLGGSVGWSVTMYDRATGKVLATSEGSVPNDRIFDSSLKVAEDMLKVACPKGFTASGGGARIKVTGTVRAIDMPFRLEGVFPGGKAAFVYTPDGPEAGSVSYTLAGGGVSGSGEGSYTLSPVADGTYTIKQTTNGCIDGVPNSCRQNSETITLTPN